jgi:hypothetical protein
MEKALIVFIPTFIVVLVINQMSYGFCFTKYCISAALPNITFFSVVISLFIAKSS